MGSEPNVHQATAADAEALARLLRQFNDEYEEESPDHEILLERIPDLIASGDGVFFIAADDRADPASGSGSSAPLGFAYLQFNPSLYSRTRDAYLGELYVIPERRGDGFGRAMLDAVLKEARARDAVHISLGTSVDDKAARGLYESLGFTNLEGGDGGPSMLYYELDL